MDCRDLVDCLGQLVGLDEHRLGRTTGHIQSYLSLFEHLTDVLDDDGDDEVGDGDSDHQDEEHEEALDHTVASADCSDGLKCEVVVEVELSGHHADGLEEGGEGVVEDIVLAESEMEGEAEGQEDCHEDKEGEDELAEDHDGEVDVHANLGVARVDKLYRR